MAPNRANFHRLGGGESFEVAGCLTLALSLWKKGRKVLFSPLLVGQGRLGFFSNLDLKKRMEWGEKRPHKLTHSWLSLLIHRLNLP